MEISPEIEQKVKKLFSTLPTTLADSLGITFTHLSKGKVVGTMPVTEKTKQPFGLLHGGASVALAETLCSIGAWIHCEEGKQAVGLEINANHLRSVREGIVQGEAVPIHIGKRTQVWEIKIFDESRNLICVSRCTLGVVG